VSIKTKSFAVAAFAATALFLHQAYAETTLDARFNDNGLAALVVNGQSFSVEGAPSVGRVRLTDEYRNKRDEARAWLQMKGPEGLPYTDRRTFEDAENRLTEQQFDAQARRLTQTYDWGTAQIEYAVDANKLDITVSAANKTGKVIEFVEIVLAKLELPGEIQYDKRARHNLGSPAVLRASYEGGRMVVVGEQIQEPFALQLAKQDNTLSVILRAGHPDGGQEVYDGVWNVRPIDRGDTDTYHVSLRFGGPNDSPVDLARDIHERFGEAFPQILDWRDRRPIGTAFFGGLGYPDDLDVNTAEGREKLRECLLNHADRIAATSKSLGLQGVIVWDIEGTEYPHPTTYIGEPRILKLIAPEMDAVVDDFFRRLDAAGLRHGMTIRPTLIWARDAEGKQTNDWAARANVWHRQWLAPNTYEKVYAGIANITPDEMQSWIERLDNKVKYCKERWGSTIFYVDTPHMWRPRARNDSLNGWQSKPLAAEIFEEVARRHPDVLLIPGRIHSAEHRQRAGCCERKHRELGGGCLPRRHLPRA